MGVPLAHLPVGTVVSTARLGDHPVGNSPACSLQSLVSQVRDLKQEVGMIGKFWASSLLTWFRDFFTWTPGTRSPHGQAIV